ncbi:hypothetical protein [Pseudoalteromonas luteoviolacea]|uniref:Uncharacterized protein n=1 Tax=Pseudoalteromonas luteoviolacea DSM 6061 TaxID=1365250 RepID=A0A166ZAF6_9GAMM|nr:hypothetical protein [Pseudoalteromonas luteoviolacea]KZN44108.1 hypothetical protein N475_08340 [Pseudoalteromonas luteoviolacea DSM 6061]MBE0386221.1 hypothetical protein [Pseudoalteromonas luteoviolacea DSM 6061]
MLNNKIRYLFIFSILALILTNVLTHIQVTTLTARIETLESTLKNGLTPSSTLQSNLDIDVLNIKSRLISIEQQLYSLQAAVPKAQVTQITPDRDNQKQRQEQRAFQQGRIDWEEKYFATLYEDSDKKALMMVEHLSELNALTIAQKQELFSVLRDNFIEVAYVITDQDAYPTIDDLTNKISELNKIKATRLSQFLNDEQLKQLNNVDWVSRFKQYAL